ncbi:hypothetical protein M9Y10_017168 [Tritrichomonas musculus]|uniref:Uncharacterized protein n=1 Tax=Tritrichomonas musculus TaxID=1915356 RepID=A0ABR2HVN0_9EUKA
MFTIEQAGSVKKVNTIDELIIEYIKKYSCQCNSNNGNNLGNSINEAELNELLKLYAKITNLDEYAKITDLFDYLKTEEFNKELLKYASSEEIQNAVDALRDYVVNNFALSTDIPENIITSESLCTTLSGYAKTDNLPDMSKYALSIDIPEPVDLTNYATKSDLSNYRLKSDLTASYLTVDYIDGEVYIVFYHDSYIKGSFVNTSNETIEFDTWFYVDNEEKVKSQEIDNNDEYKIYWNSDNYRFWIEKVGDDTQINNITITFAEKNGGDMIALINDVHHDDKIDKNRM